jgi:hypothetical protein
MKDKSKKLVRYSTAAAALLAVSGGANAAIVPGTIMTEYDGDTYDNILDHFRDFVYIDMNDDGEPDFLAGMSSYSYFGTIYRSALIYGIDGMSIDYENLIALEGSFGPRSPEPLGIPSYPMVKKYSLNNPIGPLDNPDFVGLISAYSDGGGGGPQSPPLNPFNPSNDEGFIGIQMDNDGEINYGWIHIVIGENSESVEFIACALETAPAQSILAGNSTAVPLLPIASAAGLGLIGLMAAMKKRRKLTA